MIQRKQSIWLLIAALINAGVFYFDLYRQATNTDGIAITVGLQAGSKFGLMITALLAVALPLIAIFMFKNRKQQRNFVWLGILSVIAFLAVMFYYVTDMQNSTTPPANGNYWIGSVLPVISIVFMIMALGGIRKDEKLVKSLDRLR